MFGKRSQRRLGAGQQVDQQRHAGECEQAEEGRVLEEEGHGEVRVISDQ